jgi:hypothetical protein
LHERDCAADAASGNAAVGEALDGAEGAEVAEAVEVFSPAVVRRNQAQALPIAQAARVQAKDAACFFPGEALIQASGPRVAKNSAIDYAPDVNGSGEEFGVERVRRDW